MKNKLLLIVGATAAVVVLAAAVGLSGRGTGAVSAATDGQPVINISSQQQGIWVNGEGKITVTPDIAMVNLGISSQAATVAEAQAQAAAAMDKVMAALTAKGIDKKDIQTQYFSIQQIYVPSDQIMPVPPPAPVPFPGIAGGSAVSPQMALPPKVTEQAKAYQVSNTVSVKIREIAKTGQLIDAVANAGGDDTRVNYINFSVDNPGKYNDQVRELAVKDARAKAEQLAKLSGVTLGQATFISENSYAQPIAVPAPMFKSAGMGGAYDTSISPGQADVTLNLQVAYSIN